MKRSFLGPILALGVIMLIAGHVRMLVNLREAKARDADLANFVTQYKDANDYNALFREGYRIQKEAAFLKREYTAFPASIGTLGIILILWAFDRRKMFKKFKEMQQQTANSGH